MKKKTTKKVEVKKVSKEPLKKIVKKVKEVIKKIEKFDPVKPEVLIIKTNKSDTKDILDLKLLLEKARDKKKLRAYRFEIRRKIKELNKELGK